MDNGRSGTRITLAPWRTSGAVDRGIFGGFVEHLGRCIYGGIFDEGSSLSNDNGYRLDVLSLLKELRLSVLRWPGGNFVSNYHWTDGIGPAANRPSRVELAWGALESNRFGTDEFLAFCAELGVTPYICLNMGTGDLAEALAWVEYCNATVHSYWADRRRANGHEGPYGVPYWGLGNEMYGDWQVGQLSAQEYVSTAARWAKAIRRLDPKARLVSCGLNGWSDWDRAVIDGLVDLVDLHSLHVYTGSKDYWENLVSPYQAERGIACASALLGRAAYLQRAKRAPKVAFDEWNVWYRTDDGSLEERYSFTDALAVATYLNIFIRHSHQVSMANLAQMVNAIAPIVTTPHEAVPQPIYYPFMLHSVSHLDHAIDVSIEGEQFDAPAEPAGRWGHRLSDLGPFPFVDAAATTDSARGRITVTLVNRRPDRSEDVELRLTDLAFSDVNRARALTEETDHSKWPMPDVAGVRLEDCDVPAKGSVAHVQLPPKSFAVIEASMASD
ncbi:MAG TPA: alpha-L-arabinofuranosidase C-terminal domain-containing protein [Acidimicrobiales bacterium]|nr:alpha-L-arabinofuranosidase C-terminal domain-containing protein [Acidimicrobiales bacterium]